ncbi:MAG: 2-oxoglutarate dehydrogenase complex dihydrolipoyllysine-residue succinyltransferase [Myxococcales bacterium]|nr:2-oxoglutarate dehydrogenase complex dihydrolipoyllysine-residue succinyltransferase [Myxococcales bacterium]
MKDLVVPSLGESITEAVIGKWLVDVGGHVEADEPVVDLETDKITVQMPSPVSGALTEQKYAVGDTVRVGDIIGQVDETAEGVKAAGTTDVAAPASGTAPTPAVATEPALPSASQGQGGVERDAMGRLLSPSQRKAIREGKAKIPALASTSTLAPVRPPGKEKAEEVVPMSPLRRRIAERLVMAQQGSASLTTFNEVDMSAIIGLRKLYKDEFLETHNVKLGFMSFAVKAAVEALKASPGLNAEVRDSAIVYKKKYDLGIAVGTEKGLVVPVLRDCDTRSFADVEEGIIDMAVKARTNKLILDDLIGGTFTITNGGIYGSMMSTPLLNFPQTGILGLHNIVKRAMVIGDSVEVRPVMYLALTYDHRVVDGKEAVGFLVAVKERMENPQRLMFGV